MYQSFVDGYSSLNRKNIYYTQTGAYVYVCTSAYNLDALTFLSGRIKLC